MRHTTKLVLLAMLLGQPLNAQTHTTKSSPNTLWWMTQKGTGMAGEFEINNPKNSNSALFASTNGNGPGGYFYASGNGYGVVGQSVNGIGGYFSANTDSDGVYGTSASGAGGAFFSGGSGVGVYGESNSGGGGYFVAASNDNGVYGQSASGTGGCFVNNDASGYGVYGQGKTGGYFAGIDNGSHAATYGVFGNGWYGVYGQSAGGWGVFGANSGSSGIGVHGEGHWAVQGLCTDASGYAGEFEGNVYIFGNVTAFAYNTNSDACFKTHIAALPNALDKVLALRGVTYDWRTDEFPDRRFGKGRQIGFIAQEVENVLPEIVSKDKDGYRSVDYSKVAPVLVEAIKDQQKQIKDERQRGMAQQQQIEAQLQYSKTQEQTSREQQQQIIALEAQLRLQASRRSTQGSAFGALLLLGAGTGAGLILQRRRQR